MSNNAGKMIRIALADNAPDEGQRLAALLTGPDTVVVGVAHTRTDIFPLLAQQPDVLLLAADFDPPSTITPLVKELGATAPAMQVLLLSAGAYATLEMNFADVQRALL